ncbi:TetR/AcrR family transcriptional regulator [Halobacteriales archaeon QS_8_69_26]|nr:MAG: TetR/AcrR family transcriptional regulator [Halobacteriales archaeon QS_8_69_26]
MSGDPAGQSADGTADGSAETDPDVSDSAGVDPDAGDSAADPDAAPPEESGVDAEIREEITRATYRALCEHGYANLSMQDVADEFDKSRSLLYYHYDSREDLLMAFIDDLVGWIGARLEETETEDPRARLLEYIDRLTIEPGDERHRNFIVALFELRIQAVHNDAFRGKLAEHYRGNVEAAARIIEDGVEAGVFRPVDPHDTAETMYMAIEGSRMYQVVLGAEGASTRMREALVAYVVSDLVDVPGLLDDEFGEE